jgi:hypothetical protein
MSADGLRYEDLVLAAAAIVACLAALRVVGVRRLIELGEGRGRWLALALLAAVGASVLVSLDLVRLRVAEPVDTARVVPVRGHAFALPVTIAGADQGLTGEESTLELLEEGAPLGPPHTCYLEDIAQLGSGRFAHLGRHVYFATRDGSDPRANGRRYELRHDWAPDAALVAVLVFFAALLNASRGERLLRALDTAHPAWLAAAVALVALVPRLDASWHAATTTFGGHLVKGTPFSDERDWFSLAEDFARAGRDDYGPHRPLIWIFLGAIYALTGPSIGVARAVNVAMGALAAGLIFDAVRRLASRRVALVAALAHALLPYAARMDLGVMTEPLGSFLTVAAFWAFVRAFERSAAGRTSWPHFAASGAFLALSNLARPLTLLGAGALPLALVAVAPRSAVPFRRATAGSAAFVLAFALVLAPWVLRQHARYGIWTISENSAELLYGATATDGDGRWSMSVSDLAGDLPTGERVRFFMEGAKRNVRAHPGAYLGHVVSELGEAIRGTAPAPWVVMAIAALALVAALARGARWRAVVLASALLVGAAFAPPLLAGLAVLGLVVAFARRERLALLGALHVASLAIVAVFALGIDRRLTHALDWVAAAFAAALVDGAVARLETGAWPVSPWPTPERWGRAGRAVVGACVLAAVVWVGGLVVALTRPRAPEPPSPVVDAGPWRDALDAAALPPSLAGRVVARRARVRPGFTVTLAADERLHQWCPLFAPRPYAFTVLDTVPPLTEGYAVAAGALPALEGEVVLLGVPVTRPLCGSSLEVLAIVKGTDVIRPAPALLAAHLANLER